MKACPALAGLALVVALAAPAGAVPNPPELKAFPLDGVRRLLVLAPHCDDETLGSAGLIQEVLRRGAEVRVVMATNGDGFLFATMEEFRRIYPRHEDFVRMGALRQQESLAALSLLGVPEERVSFLSYPDRGTPALWNDHCPPPSPTAPRTAGTTAALMSSPTIRAPCIVARISWPSSSRT